MRELRWPKFWLGLWLTLIAALIVVCLLPAPNMPLDIDHLDKLEHLIGYGLLGGFAANLFCRTAALLKASAALLLVGIGVEALQALVPWRTSDPLDAVANAVGVFLGIASAWTPAGNLLRWLERRCKLQP